MQARNKPGLRFYAPSPDAQLRDAVLRAHERGVEWNWINKVLGEGREDAEAVQDLLDRLEPDEQEDVGEPSTAPSLDEKRKAWQRLNRVFK
jgi:hypothetical protein